MKTSLEGRALIEYFEGRYTRAYRDPIGILSGGIGHVIPIGTEYHHEGAEIPDEVIERWFQEDLAEAEGRVSAGLDQADFDERLETQNRLDSLISMAFNLGYAPFMNTGLMRALKAGDMDAVPGQIKRWNKAGGKVLPGLVRRREAEARLFQGLPWRSPTPAPARVLLLRRGDAGPEVTKLILALIDLGYMRSDFNDAVQIAVSNFQREHGLKPDSIVGELTRAALAKALAEKESKP